MKVKTYDNGDNILVMSLTNGQTRFVKKDSLDDTTMNTIVQEITKEDLLIDENLKSNTFSTVYLSIHSSTKCNLNCSYCFRPDGYTINLTLQECIEFIDMIIDSHPKSDKYIVDATGSGEPLLNKELLFNINDYCKHKSNEVRKEISVFIATNGTLLDKHIVGRLQREGIIFGVSLDGNKKANDNNRTDLNGKSIYRKVINNVKNIKEKGFLGVASTLTGETRNVVKNFKKLHKHFPTISIKPVRSTDPNISINKNNVKYLINEYTKLYNYLLKETYKNNLNPIFSILNGDDFFGKFLLRSLRERKVSTRCDAAIARYSLGYDGKIYMCPSSIGISSFVIGNLEDGINQSAREKIWQNLLDKKNCKGCISEFYCGGECKISLFYNSNDMKTYNTSLCRFKQHLTILSHLYKYNVLQYDSQTYRQLLLFCDLKINRSKVNEDIKLVSEFFGDKYSFTEIMRLEFEEKDTFKRMLALCKTKSSDSSNLCNHI